MRFSELRPYLAYAHDVKRWAQQVPKARTWFNHRDDSPILTVIVPAHNAQRWIATLIHSIQSQDIKSVEIIVVDDNSTDRSRAIVRSLGMWDKRIRVIHGEGRGPGAARNLGIKHAKGKYLTFADADDLVLPGAYKEMLETLENSGSDFATGGYLRHRGSAVTTPSIVQRIHAKKRIGATVESFPQIIEEPVLWNKIFRRRFWDEYVGPMPEDMNYEDQPPIVSAVIEARAFDVLKRPVYSWRISDEGASRSGGKARLEDIQDRNRLVRLMWTQAESASESFKRALVKTWAERDVPMYVQYVTSKASDDSYRAEMRSFASFVLSKAQEVSGSLDNVPFKQRATLWVFATRDYPDTDGFRGLILEQNSSFVLDSESKGLLFPDLVDWEIPEFISSLRPADLQSKMIIRRAFLMDGVLAIEFAAIIPGLDPADVLFTSAVLENDTQQVNGVLQRAPADWVNAEVQHAYIDYSSSAYVLKVDAEKLLESQLVTCVISGIAAGRDIDAELGNPEAFQPFIVEDKGDGDRAIVISSSPTAHGHIVKVCLVDGKAKSIGKVRSRLPLGGKIDFEIVGEVPQLQLRARNRKHVLKLESNKDNTTASARLPLFPQRILGSRQEWALHGASDSFVVSEDSSANSSGLVYVRPTATGSPQLVQTWHPVFIHRIVNDGDQLRICGTATHPSRPTIWLISKNQSIVGQMHWNDRNFEAVFRTSELRAASYFIRHSQWAKNRFTRLNCIYQADEGKLNLYVMGSVRSVKLRQRSNGAVVLDVFQSERAAESTHYGTRSTTGVAASDLVRGIYFETFSGKTTADNPGAIFDFVRQHNFDVPLWFGIRDSTVKAPDGAIPVLVGSDEWFDILSHARVIVSNDNFPQWFCKNPGQKWLQTWHGTPIKRLVLDAHPSYIGLGYRRLMLRQAQQWDLLLGQNEFGAQRIAGSVKYQGEIRIGEYPRNSRLATSLLNVEAIKEEIGIPENKKVILYAPTWRYSHSQIAFPAAELAAENDAVVLVRGHHMRGIKYKGKNVIDVTSQKYVEELMAVSDVLVSDYSSIFFDFALTGKPAVIYAPDLEAYRNEERGFYGRWPEDSVWPATFNVDALMSEIKRALDSSEASTAPSEVENSVRRNLEWIAEWIKQALESEEGALYG